ncbi:MAG TPA: glycosyltransferase family 2 protein [Rhizomicrobium sp.]|jgi:succinoglycan biosynthesis protein ExoO|nr:glycosyltransferase family 2 protein [Rhizomicrobium sp.]
MSVAVVIAAYNAENSIERAIDSVLCQTRRPSEIIVVNDASIDNTLAVVEALSHVFGEIRIISLDRNSGPSCARNAAIRSTKTDWIAILDADDAWKPERLERLLDAAEKQPTDFVADNFIYFDVVAGVESGFGFDPSSARRLISIEDVISSDIIGYSSFVLGLLQPIMRREFLTKNRIFYNEKTQLAEDTELLIDSLIAGAKVLLLPEPYYIYSTPIGHFSKKPSPHQRTKLRLDVMAENNRLLEKKYAGLISPRSLWLLRKRGRQLMARHHAIAASQYKRSGKLFRYAIHHFRHPELIALKAAIWKERVASLFQR